MTLLRALHFLPSIRILPFLLPVSAAIAQTDVSALQWLQRIQSATQKLNYTGTFVNQYGQQVETSRITHVVDATGPHERLEALDGVPREMVRHRDEVICYFPASHTVKIDRQPDWRLFPGILPAQLRELAENYRIGTGGVERVAGYDCQVIVLAPKDRMRYGRWLCADVRSGMMLKTQTLDANNGVTEQFAFTQLQIGGNIDPERLKSQYSRRSRDWRVEDSSAAVTKLADAGWFIKSRPAGFRTVTELTRTLGGTAGVGHIVLSDGLAAVSIFIEPAVSKHPAPNPGLVRQGAVNVYMRPVGNYWVTVVGEAPPESVKYIANAVEHRR